MATKKNKIAVILGAGASVDAGLPTSQALTRMIYSDITSKNHWMKTNARLLGYVISRLQARNTRLGRSPYDPIEVEELFDALQSLANRDTVLLSEFVERWDRALDEFEDSFDGSLIGRNFGELVGREIAKRQRDRHSFGASDSDFVKFARSLQPTKSLTKDHFGIPSFQRPFFSSLYKNLAVEKGRISYLKPLIESQNINIIASLNYDLAVEMCAQSCGKDIDYGLDRWEQQKLVSWRGDDSIKLLKLHGSMNWTGSSEDIVVRADEIKEHESRVMIFGGVANKLSADGPFLQFLNRLESALNEATTIVIIGYSFRDSHINALLRRRRMTKRNTRMVVIDPSPPALWQIGFREGDLTREKNGRKYTYALDLELIESGAKDGIRQLFP